jgi:hypothetical protein
MGRGRFTQDGNWGLVERCIRRLRSQAIRKLTETYVSLSLAHVAKAIELDPDSPESLATAEAEIRALVGYYFPLCIHRRQEVDMECVCVQVESGELHATVTPDADGTPATVTFIDDPEPFNTPDAVEALGRTVRDARLTFAHIEAYDEQLARRKAFIQKVLSYSPTVLSSVSLLQMPTKPEKTRLSARPRWPEQGVKADRRSPLPKTRKGPSMAGSVPGLPAGMRRRSSRRKTRRKTKKTVVGAVRGGEGACTLLSSAPSLSFCFSFVCFLQHSLSVYYDRCNDSSTQR